MAKPEKTFRLGSISASVFVNTVDNQEGGQRSFRAVLLQRSYRDGGDWKTSSSFRLADLPAAIAVMQMAMNHIAPIEAEISS